MKIYDLDLVIADTELWNKPLGKGIIVIIPKLACIEVSGWVNVYTLDGKLYKDKGNERLATGVYVVVLSKLHWNVAQGVSFRYYYTDNRFLLGALE